MTLAEPNLAEKRIARAQQVAVREHAADAIEQVLIRGDLKSLTPEQRNAYYMRLCESTGLNPLTQPFEYLTLNGKLVLYAKRSCTDQLRSVHGVSVVDMDEQDREGVYIVTVKVQDKHGRTDMAKGAVNISGLKGEGLANAMMKAETKAKRRATLSICGLGLLDETEVETIPGAMVATDAAGGKPQTPAPTRQQQSSAAAKRDDVWPRFTSRLDGFTDLDALEQWWADGGTQAAIDQMPRAWQEQAAEAYEKKQEALINAGRP